VILWWTDSEILNSVMKDGMPVTNQLMQA
jgi:hypothetical protein